MLIKSLFHVYFSAFFTVHCLNVYFLNLTIQKYKITFSLLNRFLVFFQKITNDSKN